MKANKYNYLKVMQQNYGQGWEDVSEYPQKRSVPNREEINLLKHDLREYKLTGYATRVINRKELKD